MNIIGIGDSWEDYPRILGTGGGLLDHLSSILGVSITNLAKAGDSSLQTMGLKKSQLMEKALSENKPDFLIVSSGGDDIAGDQFCIWLNQNTDDNITHAVNWKRMDAAIELIMADYQDLADIRDRLSPKTIMVTHGYDFPVPSMMGKGVLWLGPWLQPGFEYCGWTKVEDQVAITKSILMAFNAKLAFMASQSPSNWIHCQTQGTLSQVDWDNEIHPNRQGFQKLALVMNAAMLPFINNLKT